MRVSVNLVTWNGEKFIKDCLQSVFNQTFKDFDLLIIDNNSTDDTLAIINEMYPHLRVVKNRENLGFAKAHNQAIHWSKSDFVLALNQDVVLHPDYLRSLVEFFDQNPQAGSASGKILRLQDGMQTSYIDTLGLKIQKNHRVVEIAAGELDSGQYEAVEEVFGVSAALAMYRRKALQSIEYQKEFFDEDFFCYKEDVDLSYRLRYAGWEAFYQPLAVAYHNRSVSGSEAKTKMKIAKNRKRQSKFANYLSYRNHWYLLIKNLPKFNFKYIWPVFWFELMKFFYILVMEPKNLKVFKEVIKNRKKFLQKRKFIFENKKIKISDINSWLA